MLFDHREHTAPASSETTLGEWQWRSTTEDTENTESEETERVRIQNPEIRPLPASVTSVLSVVKTLARLAQVALIVVAVDCAGARLATRTYPTPSPDELLAAVRARQAAVRGMNVEARATSWLGGERVRATVQMLVERGGQLRFEAEVPLQGTVAALAVNRGQFTFLDHHKHLFRKGPACPASVAALIRIPLAPPEVAAILLGDVPIPQDGKAGPVEWDSARAADVLVIEGAPGTGFRLGLRRPDVKLAAWDILFVEGQSPTGRWRVAYDDFERTGPLALPRLIRFAEPGKDFDDGVEIKIRERALNPVFPEGAFALAPPSGYTVESASCVPTASY
jgi:hypothetical protein